MSVAVAHIYFRSLTPREKSLLRLTESTRWLAVEAFQGFGMALAGATVALEDLAGSLSRTPELEETGGCSHV